MSCVLRARASGPLWVGSPHSQSKEAAVDRDLRLREIVSAARVSDWQVPRYSGQTHGPMVNGRFRPLPNQTPQDRRCRWQSLAWSLRLSVCTRPQS